MSDTACGKNRLPFPSGTPPEAMQCELAAWQSFASNCGGCVDQECRDQLYDLYLQQRAHCAELGGT